MVVEKIIEEAVGAGSTGILSGIMPYLILGGLGIYVIHGIGGEAQKSIKHVENIIPNAMHGIGSDISGAVMGGASDVEGAVKKVINIPSDIYGDVKNVVSPPHKSVDKSINTESVGNKIIKKHKNIKKQNIKHIESGGIIQSVEGVGNTIISGAEGIGSDFVSGVEGGYADISNFFGGL